MKLKKKKSNITKEGEASLRRIALQRRLQKRELLNIKAL